MSNVLNIAPEHDKKSVRLAGIKRVAFDRRPADGFQVNLFTGTNETFELSTSVSYFVDQSGTTVRKMTIGGKAGTSVDIRYNATTNQFNVFANTQEIVNNSVQLSTVTADVNFLKNKPAQLSHALAIIGSDQMARYYTSGPTTGASYLGAGLVTWAQALSRQRLQIVASPAVAGAPVVEGSTPSRTKKSLFKQLDDAIAAGASQALVMGGVNDLMAGVPYVTLQQGWIDFLDKAAANNIYVWMLSQTPIEAFDNGARMFQQTIMQMNNWLRRECAKRRGVRFIDVWPVVTQPMAGKTASLMTSVAWKPFYSVDGRLTTNLGAFYIGKMIAKIWNEEFLDRDLLVASSYDSIAANQPQSTNVYDNPLFSDVSSVLGVVVTKGGTGYSANPTVTVNANGGGGSGAVLRANVTGGVITSISLVAGSSGLAQTGFNYNPDVATITITDPTGTGAEAILQFGPVGLRSNNTGVGLKTTPRADGCGNDITMKFNTYSNNGVPISRGLIYSSVMSSGLSNYISSNDVMQAMVEITAGGDIFTSGGLIINTYGVATRVYASCAGSSGDRPIPEQFTGVFCTPPAPRGNDANAVEMVIYGANNGTAAASDTITMTIGRLSLRAEHQLVFPKVIKTDVKFNPGHYLWGFADWNARSVAQQLGNGGFNDGPSRDGILPGTTAAMRGYMRHLYWRTFETTKVQDIEIINGGKNYTNPTVTIDDPGIIDNGVVKMKGSGAVVTAIVTNGVITGFNISNKGNNYTPYAKVIITDPTGTGAEAEVLPYDFFTIADDLWYLDTWRNNEATPKRVPKKLMVYFAPDGYLNDWSERIPDYIALDPKYFPAGDRMSETASNKAAYAGVIPYGVYPHNRALQFTVVNGGSGYTNDLVVTWSSSSGSGTTKVTIVNGVVTAVAHDKVTSGYITGNTPTVNISHGTGTGLELTVAVRNSFYGWKLRYHSPEIQDRVCRFMKALSKWKAKKWTGTVNGVDTFEWVTFDQHPAFEMVRFEETSPGESMRYYCNNRNSDYVEGMALMAAHTNSYFRHTTVSHGFNFVPDANLPRFARMMLQTGVTLGVVDIIPGDTSLSAYQAGCYTWIKDTGLLNGVCVLHDGGNYMSNFKEVPQHPDVALRGALTHTGVTHMVWHVQYNNDKPVGYRHAVQFLKSLGCSQSDWELDPTGNQLNGALVKARINTTTYPDALPANNGLSASLNTLRPYITNA